MQKIPIFVCPTTVFDHPLLRQSPRLSECIGLSRGYHHSIEYLEDMWLNHALAILQQHART